MPLAVQAPTEVPPSKPSKKGVIAIVARCTAENSDAERKYTHAVADLLRVKLAEDTTITLLPASITDDIVAGFVVPGYVSSGTNELKSVSSKLPSECNILIVVGPFPKNEGWFQIWIDRPSDLSGVHFDRSVSTIEASGSPENMVGSGAIIRHDIDVILKTE